MESPEVGGATVFPKIGVTVTPVRRAALFWYNMLPSGNGDLRTLHAGCPVLIGSKWVSNKWIFNFGQEFRRPCNLKIEDVPYLDPFYLYNSQNPVQNRIKMNKSCVFYFTIMLVYTYNYDIL